jgi:hypothetical protein
MATSANYGWILPTPEGDVNTWGEKLNVIFATDTTTVDCIDTVVAAISAVANAALPLAGGTMTGDVHFSSTARLTENENTMSSGTQIDWANGNFFTKNLGAGNTTITFANLPADGTVQFITVDFRQPSGGNGTVTWPTVIWQDSVAPTLSTEAYHHDIFTFFCYNGTDVIAAQVLTALDYAGTA